MRILPWVLQVLACAVAPSAPASRSGAPDAVVDSGTLPVDSASESGAPCPAAMAWVALPEGGAVCMDLYEAPGLAGGLPLVMYSFDEAEAWCAARGRRLCFDDEWEAACAGAAGLAFPYGESQQPGLCNDEETWRTYDQSLLNGWPTSAGSPEIESLDALWAAASTSSSGAAAVEHLQWLYQGEPSGQNGSCTNETGTFDLIGNVEEWTRRRAGGSEGFHGNLKGRYWAESRSCQQDITTHGDGFHFYEIGFRCCEEPVVVAD